MYKIFQGIMVTMECLPKLWVDQPVQVGTIELLGLNQGLDLDGWAHRGEGGLDILPPMEVN